MNYAIHRISLDVTDDSPSQLTIAAKQGDTAKILIVSLLDDKKNYQIAHGSVAVFIAKKDNGVWLEHPCTIDYTNNKVIYTFQESTVKSSGKMECEIHISFTTTVKNEDGSTELVTEDLTTASFVIAVHDTILSGLDDDKEEATLLPDLITKGTSLFTTLEQVSIPNAEEATEKANIATNNANIATENAEEATGEANTATANANTATENANTATAEANQATADARELIAKVEESLENGDFNGHPVTHSWNGTTLTVTSASGTSSSDLKGDKGDKGDTSQDFIEHNKGTLVKLFVGTTDEWNSFTGDKTNMLFVPTDDSTREDILAEVNALCDKVASTKLYRHQIYVKFNQTGGISNFRCELYIAVYTTDKSPYTEDNFFECVLKAVGEDNPFPASGVAWRGGYFPIYAAQLSRWDDGSEGIYTFMSKPGITEFGDQYSTIDLYHTKGENATHISIFIDKVMEVF